MASWAVVDLFRIKNDVSTGQRILRSAGAVDLAKPRGLTKVAEAAQRRFVRADGLARTSLPLRLVRPVPLFGRQVAILRSMTRTAAEVGAIGDRATRTIQARLDKASEGPPARVALLEAVVTEVDNAQARLKAMHYRRDGWALPPLRTAQDKLINGLANARTKLNDATVMTVALKKMFVGPSKYLILAGNNAEMRAGGMPLSTGVANLTSGQIVIGGFRPTGQLLVNKVPIPNNLNELYGWMSFGAEWRATTASPNFPVAGELYYRMAGRAKLGIMDGVIFVDVHALRAVLQATGPVDLDGVTYTTKNIAQAVMNENYIKFPDQTDDASIARYDLQSRLATAIFAALNTRPVKLGTLVANLSETGKGRHLLAFSRDPGMEKVFIKAGISGGIPPNGLMVNLHNISANKLDWYIKPKIDLQTVWVKRGVRRVNLKVTFTNPPRTRTSDVVEGITYDRTHGMADGEHRVFFVAYLPKPAFDVASADPPFSTAGTDAGMKVVGFNYSVKVGDTRTVTVSFSVPKNQVFQLLPMARAHSIKVTADGRTFNDDQRRVFKLTK
jgi:hypothetical protein